MTYTTYAVDVEWKTGQADCINKGTTFQDALSHAARLKRNDAIARVTIVKVVSTTVVVRDWKRRERGIGNTHKRGTNDLRSAHLGGAP